MNGYIRIDGEPINTRTRAKFFQKTRNGNYSNNRKHLYYLRSVRVSFAFYDDDDDDDAFIKYNASLRPRHFEIIH